MKNEIGMCGYYVAIKPIEFIPKEDGNDTIIGEIMDVGPLVTIMKPKDKVALNDGCGVMNFKKDGKLFKVCLDSRVGFIENAE